MGSAFACCETKKEERYEEEEIKLKSSYNALSNDFLKIEPQYNYLNKITFTEFSVLLSKYTNMTANINYDSKKPIDIFHKSKFYSTNFDEGEFQSFIETKIFKCDALYEVLGKDETTSSIFRDMFLEIYRGVQQILRKYLKDKTFVLKKYHILAIGLIYCGGRNREKINFLFDCFKTENGKLINSDEFKDFIKTVFLIPSYGLVAARRKLGKKYENIGELPLTDITVIINAFEMKDIERLIGIFGNTLFATQSSFIKQEFVDQFKTKDIGWILSPSGIRKQLEDNNDDEGIDLKKRAKESNVFNRWGSKVSIGSNGGSQTTTKTTI